MNSHDTDSSPARLSRRSVVGSAAGLAALTLASGVKAQEATPTVANGSLLFVQSFSASTLDPSGDDADTLILTLERDSGQTLYFSDRPDRLVGLIDTATFVEMFRAETAQDPANAALVGQLDEDESDVATHVVELLTLEYDSATNTARYTVRLLGGDTDPGLGFRHQPDQTIDDLRRYGASQLFIDAGGLMQLVAYGAQDVYLDGATSEG